MVRSFRNFLLAWLWLCAAGIAGEVSLRGAAEVNHAVVRLGDVAELYDVPEERCAELLALELLPSPAAGGAQTVGAREIQEALERRSAEFAQWTFTGANLVTVARAASPRVKPAEAVKPPARMSRVAGAKAQAQLEEAILQYVHERLGDDAWQVAVELNDSQLASLAAGKAIRVTGGRYLDDERVQFRVEVGEGAALETWKIVAAVTLPPMVVVAARDLDRGEIVTEHDIELVRAGVKRVVEPLETLEDAIGREVTRVARKGQPLSAKGLRMQLMVKRGQVVTVYSRCGGVQIRTTGRAKEDGGLGDLVPVEAIGKRETFHARVSGHQEVEIFAAAVSAPVVEDAPREPSPWLAQRRREAAERSGARSVRDSGKH